MIRRSTGERVFNVFNIAFITVLCFVCLLPMVHVLAGSLSDPYAAASTKGFILWPLGKINIESYRIILGYSGVWIGYRNTIVYVILQCALTGFLSTIGGYILSRRSFRYRGAFMVFVLIPMLFNGGMISTFMVIQKLKLLNTMAVMLLPTAINSFYFILMRTAMMGIPASLEEAAKIDGAGELRILFQVILPLCKATFAVIILFIAVAKWNEYFTALIYLPSRPDLYPLQMYLKNILQSANDITNANQVVENASAYNQLVKYSLIVVSSAPVLCIYPFVQKYFVSGIMIGSLKG